MKLHTLGVFLGAVVVFGGPTGIAFPQDPPPAPQTLSIGFKTEWDAPDVDPALYKEIFINIIDVRDMNVTLIDDEDEKFVEGIDEGTLEEIAYSMYKYLVEALDMVIPVNQDDVDTKMASSGPALIVNVKLSSDFVIEEKRALEPFISDASGASSQSSPGEVTFECSISDLETGQHIVSLTDTQKFSSENSRRPFANAPDKQAFISLAKIWGKRVANSLTTQMKKKTVSQEKENPSSYRDLLDDFSQEKRLSEFPR